MSALTDACADLWAATESMQQRLCVVELQGANKRGNVQAIPPSEDQLRPCRCVWRTVRQAGIIKEQSNLKTAAGAGVWASGQTE